VNSLKISMLKKFTLRNYRLASRSRNL
jgi:hypothetical protein